MDCAYLPAINHPEYSLTFVMQLVALCVVLSGFHTYSAPEAFTATVDFGIIQTICHPEIPFTLFVDDNN